MGWMADIVRNKLVDIVRAGKGQFISRHQVEGQLPDVKVNWAQWATMDMNLR